MPVEIFNKDSNFQKNLDGSGAVSIKNGMLVNTTARHERFKQYDEELLGIAKQELVGVNDLVSRGLTKALSNVGVTISYYERYGDVIDASVSMDGQTRAENDVVVYDEVGVPVPVYHGEWGLSFRQKAALSAGNDIDVTYNQQVAYNITGLMDNDLFNGNSKIVVSGQNIYGYTNHPDRNTYTIPTAWTSATGVAIVQDVINMRQKNYDDNYRVPMVLYVGNDYEPILDKDFSDAKGDNTIRQRILALSDIVDIRVSNKLATNNVVLVAMDRRVVDVAIAQGLSNLTLKDDALSESNITFAIQTPRVKSTKSGQSGVCHGSV